MLRSLICAVVTVATAFGAEEPGVPFFVAQEGKRIGVTASGNGRDTLHLQVTAAAKIRVNIPAGAIFQSDAGEQQIVLRSLAMEPGPGADVDAILPAAALSSHNTAHERSVTLAGTGDEKLAKLLELFGQQNDLPRPTAQLAIFVSLENLGWVEWKKWLEQAWRAEKPAKQHPTPAEVAQAVDGIAFARLANPDRKLSILADEELKRLALRNPWARGKAMALYGLSVEDALTGDASLPVDLSKLLHTSPNDNCPICRQRNKGPAEIP
jgi:hypothetical protein